MSAAAPPQRSRVVNVAVINPYAPRPYTFSEAALCLRDAIRAAGYASELTDNHVDVHQRCIVLGALPAHFDAVEQLDRRSTIIANFEQLEGGSAITGDRYVPWLRQWLVADYHARNVEWLHAHSPGQHVLELPLKPSPAVAFRPPTPPTGKSIDVLFFGTPNERRTRLLQELEGRGLHVEVVAGAYAEELAPAVLRARLVLHVHFYPSGLFPVLRFLQPVMQGVPIVCEESVFSPLADWSRSGIVFAPYEGLVDACVRLLGDPEAAGAQARRNREFAAAIDFATPFERLLQELDAMPWVQPAPLIAMPSAVTRTGPPPGVAPPSPLAPPVGTGNAEPPAPPAASAPAASGEDGPLTTEEIEAILAHEAEQLPPEPHVAPPPLKMVERQPGEGRFGIWVVWLLILFSFYTIYMSMK